MEKKTTLSQKDLTRLKKATNAKNGGLIRVSFTFDGIEYVKTHRLTQGEMNEQRQMLADHGINAFGTVLLRATIWGAARLGEHAVTEAFKDYARKHFREQVIDQPEQPEQPEQLKLEQPKLEEK